MNEVTGEWVFKAEEDFHSADTLLHATEVTRAGMASFHCQQCAEKYLKAYLQEYAIRFEHRHDLLPLVSLCREIDDSFGGLEDDLKRLERYAVAIRYPARQPPWKWRRKRSTLPNMCENSSGGNWD